CLHVQAVFQFLNLMAAHSTTHSNQPAPTLGAGGPSAAKRDALDVVIACAWSRNHSGKEPTAQQLATERSILRRHVTVGKAKHSHHLAALYTDDEVHSVQSYFAGD